MGGHRLQIGTQISKVQNSGSNADLARIFKDPAYRYIISRMDPSDSHVGPWSFHVDTYKIYMDSAWES